MSTNEIASRLVELCRQGKFEEAQKELYADNAVSVEPEDAPGLTSVEGLENIVDKGRQFQAMVEEVHSLEMSDAVVAGNYFSLSLIMDVTFKGMGRTNMDEIAVYKVDNGKVVREEFFYETKGGM